MTITATAPAITGVHPYADKFPMLPDSELQELAESILQNGLRQPIVLTEDGLILDGRNRAKACEMAGVTPDTVVYDGDDLAEYVLDSNDSRRHMSAGARAMSAALVMEADGRRRDGRWVGWKRSSQSVGKSSGEVEATRRAGIVIDFAPDLAEAVVWGEIDLASAFHQAEERRDAERRKLEEQERLKAEEADAQSFIEENAPDLAARVDGKDLHSYVEARDIWSRRNREEAERIRREKRDKEQREAEERANAEQRAKTAADAHYRLHALTTDEHRARVLESAKRFFGSLPSLHREVFTPDHLHQTADALRALADEMENSNA